MSRPLSLAFVLSLLVVLVGCGGSNPNDELTAPPVITETPVDAGADQAAGQPGQIKIVTTGTPTTTEAGGRATFAIALSAKPSTEVVVPIASPTETEIKVEPSALTFGPNDWDQPKPVTLIGQNEDVADGDKTVRIGIGPATSADSNWNGVKSDGIDAVNKDDDTAGIDVSAPEPTSSTTEAGTKVTFTVRLKSKPSAAVTIAVTSSLPTEGTVDKAQLVFGETDWMTPQTVTVTGQDDAVADLDKAYDIDLAKPVTTDAVYAALAASKIALTNLDDDTPGFFVFAPAPANRFTTEAGGTMSFTVRLRSKPTADVTIPVSSSKVAEGTIQGAVTQLVFTPGNYDQLQTVTVKGADDKIDDGDQAYSVLLGAVTSADASYQGKDPPDVDLTNKDDDTAAILVSAPSASMTTEAGGAVTFKVKLGSEPTAPVTLSVISSKPAEGQPNVSQLVFDSTNWMNDQTVTVTGQNDDVDDGDQAYVIQLAHKVGSVTTDAKYAAIDPNDVNLTNSDNDTQGITITGPNGGTFTTEGKASVTFDVVLKTKPTGDVTLPISISNAEAKTNKNQLVFTTDNWNQVQTVTITGENDDVDDGDRTYDVVFGQSSGGGYNVDPADVTLTNVDDDTAAIQQSVLTGTLTEVGGQAKFKVRLASKPAGVNQVVVPVTITAGNATRSPTSLTFTTGNWDQEQEVTISGTGDGQLMSTAPSVSIAVGPATSGDAKYSGLSSAGFSNVSNTSACGIGGTNAGEGETCDDANATKCDGCESCVKQQWALIPPGAKIATGAATAATAAGTTMCVDAWAKLGGGADGIIAASITAADDIDFSLQCDATGRLTFGSQKGTDLLYAEALATKCANGEWHHVAGCRALDGTDLTMRVFLDGTLVGTSAVGTTDVIGSAAPITFGYAFPLGTTGLDGAIDEVHLHKTLRTADFTPERHPAATANTVAIWRFNEGTGTTAASIPTNYVATLSGGASFANDTGYTNAFCQ